MGVDKTVVDADTQHRYFVLRPDLESVLGPLVAWPFVDLGMPPLVTFAKPQTCHNAFILMMFYRYKDEGHHHSDLCG